MPFSPQPHNGTRRASLVSSLFQDFRHLSLGDMQARSSVPDAEQFVPTPEQIEQSRRNQQESLDMFTDSTHSSSQGSQPIVSRVLNSLDIQMHRRSSSVVEVMPRISTADMTLPASAVRPHTSASPPTRMLEVDAERARQTRMLRRKSQYSSMDNLRLAREADELSRAIATASPGAIYVTSRRAGLLTVASECHGFCYDTPVTVRISSYPVLDDDVPRKKKARMSVHGTPKTFSRAGLQDEWSKLCIAYKATIYTTPPIPFHRMLKLKQIDLILSGNSGDLLLEGSMYRNKHCYMQSKTAALSAHVSLIYKEPQSGLIYVLTSRRWSKAFTKYEGHDNGLLDLNTFEQVDGVQMHPLEEYMRIQRNRGVYFIYRKLQRMSRRLNWHERDEIGQALYAWYSEHQKCGFPSPSELRHRLDEALYISDKLKLSSRGTKLLNSKTFSSSQAVMEALKYVGVMSSEITPASSMFSVPGHFEMKGLKYASNLGANAWNYDVMTYITGDFMATSLQSRLTGDVSMARPVESGAV